MNISGARRRLNSVSMLVRALRGEISLSLDEWVTLAMERPDVPELALDLWRVRLKVETPREVPEYDMKDIKRCRECGRVKVPKGGV